MDSEFNKIKSKLFSSLNIFSDFLEIELTIPFDKKLFNPLNETVTDYVDEINTTIAYLISAKATEDAQWWSEKYVAQYHALDVAINEYLSSSKQIKPVPKNSKSVVHQPENKKQAMTRYLNSLSPRERLDKYYEFLRRLNSQYDSALAQIYQNNDEHNSLLNKHLETIKQRRDSCQLAIDNLEAYLTLPNS